MSFSPAKTGQLHYELNGCERAEPVGTISNSEVLGNCFKLVVSQENHRAKHAAALAREMLGFERKDAHTY
jgi:hypothetical protein